MYPTSQVEAAPLTSARLPRAMVRALGAALGAALLAGTIAPALAAEPRPTDFRFTMSGAEVVPGPGDPDGSATAALSLWFDKPYQACAGTVPSNTERPYTSLGLHRAPAGEEGPLVVVLTDGATPQSGCGEVDKKVLADIRNNPELYYLQAANAEFPDGALRGQLG